MLVYLFFKMNAPELSWFWTTLFGGGSLLLFIFSPGHRISAGLRMVHAYEWPFMIAPFVLVFLVGPNQYTLNADIEVRIMSCICGTSSVIGYSVFWKKVVVGIIWKRIRSLLN